MATDIKQYDLKVYSQNNEISAEIRFIDWQDPLLKKMQDLLAESIKNNRNLEILKDVGYPTELDKNYILFEKSVFEEAKNLIENFKKDYPNVSSQPGLFAFLFKTKNYKGWENYIKKREEKEKQVWENIHRLMSCKIEITHDYPYVDCLSKIHSKEDFISEIDKIAGVINIKLNKIT